MFIFIKQLSYKRCDIVERTKINPLARWTQQKKLTLFNYLNKTLDLPNSFILTSRDFYNYPNRNEYTYYFVQKGLFKTGSLLLRTWFLYTMNWKMRDILPNRANSIKHRIQ